MSLREQRFSKSLSWTDGFMLALIIPVSTFTLIGLEIGPIGAWGALAVWLITSIVGLLQNFIYADLALLMPEHAGGIGAYAHEAWRRYASPLGAIALFGYWAGWSLTLCVVGLQMGQLIQAQWFPSFTGTISLGVSHVGLPHLLAATAIISIFFLNIGGVKPVVRTNKFFGGVLGILALVCLIGPLITHQVHFSNLHWGLNNSGGIPVWEKILIWSFIVSWTSYGTEVCATFAPEYANPRRNLVLSLLSSSFLVLIIVLLSSIVLPGAVGQSIINANPLGFYTNVVQHVTGKGFAGVVIAILCVAQFVAMNSATAGSSRALFGLAERGLTLRQFNSLNSHGVPARAMGVDMVVNLFILFFVGNVTGVIFASNLGYLIAVVLTLTGFLILKKRNPQWQQILCRHPLWVPGTIILALFNIAVIIAGFLHPAVAGYGGLPEQVIAVSILILSLFFFAYRRIVQDKTGLKLQERD